MSLPFGDRIAAVIDGRAGDHHSARAARDLCQEQELPHLVGVPGAAALGSQAA